MAVMARKSLESEVLMHKITDTHNHQSTKCLNTDCTYRLNLQKDRRSPCIGKIRRFSQLWLFLCHFVNTLPTPLFPHPLKLNIISLANVMPYIFKCKGSMEKHSKWMVFYGCYFSAQQQSIGWMQPLNVNL